MQIGCAAEEQGQEQANMARMQGRRSSEKVKDDDRRECYHCREASRVKSRSRTRLKDLADAEWKPVTANYRPSSIAADAPLADDHVTMFLETTMRSDADSTASDWVRTRETHICDSNVRNMSVDRHMCRRRHLSKRILSNRTEGYNGGNNAIRDSTR